MSEVSTCIVLSTTVLVGEFIWSVNFTQNSMFKDESNLNYLELVTQFCVRPYEFRPPDWVDHKELLVKENLLSLDSNRFMTIGLIKARGLMLCWHFEYRHERMHWLPFHKATFRPTFGGFDHIVNKFTKATSPSWGTIKWGAESLWIGCNETIATNVDVP